MGNPTEGGSPRPERVARPLATALAGVAGLMRLVPHWWNFTPLGALGLYSGARLRSWHAFAVPLTVMAVTDFLLWALSGLPPFNPYVYAAFMFYVLIGRLLRRTESPWRIGAASLLASVVFFLVTNFGVWVADIRMPQPKYTATFEGLVMCYTFAIPFFNTDAPPLGFFGNMILGDLSLCALLFGAHAFLTRWAFPAERVGAAAGARQDTTPVA